MSTPDDREPLARVGRALRLVTVPFPHLSGLVAATRVSLEARLPTMGVFASGRLAVNRDFVDRLSDNDLMFVLAHEMLHLALRTHDRMKGSATLEFNYAHDYIINDMLRAELGVASIPAHGLDLPGARERSAEDIVLEMRRNGRRLASRTQVWEGREVTASQRFPGAGSGAREERQSAAGGSGSDDGGDVLADDLERQWYPDDRDTQQQEIARIKALAAKALALAEAMEAVQRARGTSPGTTTQNVEALRGLYRTPWQLALQRWMEAVAPGERTFTRASRRGQAAAGVVLPGRRRQGWLLNVVLDTSASMSEAIPRALGAIAGFCDAVGVDQIRLVQCDAAVTSDQWLAPDSLLTLEISGYGGSDLSPALLNLADDSATRAAVVITDGDILYPDDPLPYDILWVLHPAGAFNSFTPRYGRVVAMQ